jgi:hypothetical protein
MKTVNIKGKNYVMVNERIKYFRDNFKDWSLTSELVSLTDDSCVIKAIVSDENGRVMATGFAQENRESSMINKTSFVENCETSAWGRALGNLGIGIDDSIASAEEVDMAIKKQDRQNSIIGGEYLFTSGNFKGKTIAEADAEDGEYLNKLLEWDKLSDILRKNIEAYLKFKKQVNDNTDVSI